MCEIIVALTKRPVVNILLVGLKRLEYPGYDFSKPLLLEMSS